MKIKTFAFNAFQQNMSVLYDDSKECVVVDPGCYEKQEEEELSKFIEENELKVVKLLNTHCHIDHVLGNLFVANKYGVELYIHKEDLPTLKGVPSYASIYGFPAYIEKDADHFIEEGDNITFGNTTLEVIFAPGHAPGHVVFFHRESKQLINGDVLFNGSIGRTDLPGGNHEQLIQSIHEKIFPLGDDVVVYCGHGGTTTIGKEKASNPFCAVNLQN